MGVGEFTRDFRKGAVYSDIPPEVAEHLMDHGVLVEVEDAAADNEWFDSEDRALAGPEATAAVEATELAARVQAQAARAGIDEEVVVTVEETEVGPLNPADNEKAANKRSAQHSAERGK